MRRALLSTFGIAALSLATPGVALAHHHHHKNRSKAHHAKVHFVHIGARGLTPQASPNSSVEEPKTAAPSNPSEGAGKIASFTEGVLTITLNDGSSVSGKVTSNTEIKCEKAQTTPPAAPEGDKESEDSTTTHEDSNVEGGDKGDEGDDNGSGDDGEVTSGATEPPCDSSALTPGTVVREAELKVGPSGAEFESIVLVR